MVWFILFQLAGLAAAEPSPIPALYRGPDGLRLLVREMPWLGNPRLYRFDFVAGPRVRGTVILDVPAPDDGQMPMKRRIRVPHDTPQRRFEAGTGLLHVAWSNVELVRGGTARIRLVLTRSGRVHAFTYREGERAGITCAPQLDPVSRNLDRE